MFLPSSRWAEAVCVGTVPGFLAVQSEPLRLTPCWVQSLTPAWKQNTRQPKRFKFSVRDFKGLVEEITIKILSGFFFQPLYRLAAFCLQLVWDGIPQRIMVYGLIMTWSKDMVLHATHWCNQTFPLRYICCVRVIVVNYQTGVKNGLYWVAKHCRKISNL